VWDTFFCTLLASEASKELAYSNLIEITRPTVRGNVPGFRTAETTVSDRSKPYVGSFITLAHYNRFGDKWIVELLYPSLLMWWKWIKKERVSANGLVFIGSDNVTKQYSDGAQCTTTAAKWESGLDNSPMYDDLDITKSPLGEPCALPIWDVGMTGLYLSMCADLGELATVRLACSCDTRARAYQQLAPTHLATHAQEHTFCAIRTLLQPPPPPPLPMHSQTAPPPPPHLGLRSPAHNPHLPTH
jgi:hypothetical protein